MKSEDFKNQLKRKLQQLISDLDNSYYSIESELENEILEHKEKIEKINEETNKIYNKLTDELCVKLIKNKLPLRVKLFNEISWAGKSIVGNGYIDISFCFNKDYNCFKYLFGIDEIKELLKLKDGD